MVLHIVFNYYIHDVSWTIRSVIATIIIVFVLILWWLAPTVRLGP